MVGGLDMKEGDLVTVSTAWSSVVVKILYIGPGEFGSTMCVVEYMSGNKKGKQTIMDYDALCKRE